jgi:hypothetical protein
MAMKNSKSKNQLGVNCKVVCINDDFSNLPALYKIIFKFPVANQIYTIRGIDSNGNLFLNEVVNEVYEFPFGAVAEPSFLKWRFNPLSQEKIKSVKKKKKLEPIDKYSLTKTIDEMDIRNWFYKLSDNQRLSLFLKRINSDEATIYDNLLQNWWVNRY